MTRPRITVLAGALLVLALAGCAERGHQSVPASSSSAAQQEGSEPSGPPTTSTGKTGTSTVDQRSADQIADAVGSAQAALNGLDQDFAGDDAAAGN